MERELTPDKQKLEKMLMNEKPTNVMKLKVKQNMIGWGFVLPAALLIFTFYL